MNSRKERIIEVEVTKDDILQMRADGIAESDIPSIGIKKYRPARHLVKDKVAILVDIDIVEHFKQKVDNGDSTFYQTQINRSLRGIIENDNR